MKVNTRTRVDISGIEQLNKKAGKLKENLYDILADAALAGADIVREDASDRARKKSGEMANGIISKVTWDKRAPVAFAACMMDPAKNDIFIKRSANGKRYYYPASIEYGHPGAPAYPFMRPAMDSKKAQVRKEIRGRVKQVVEGVRG